MITFLGTEDGIQSIRGNHPMVDPATRDRIEVETYRDAIRRSDWYGGAIIFGDLERLYASELPDVAELWQRLSQASVPVRLLNNPARTLRRFALLRKLQTAGINDFDVWRADEMRPGIRFPVFLRGERDHNGPLTPLLSDRTELDEAVEALAERGVALNQILVVEFCETRSPDGLYRKMGTFRVGERFINRNIFCCSNWCVKGTGDPIDARHSRSALMDEEEAFIFDAEIPTAIPEIFRLAAIDYGRIDYALQDGRIRVWEINTNPVLGDPATNHPGVERFDRYFARSFVRMQETLMALDPDGDDQPFWIDPVRAPRAVVAAGANRRRAAAGGGWRGRLLRR
jgi:hypothetical protein